MYFLRQFLLIVCIHASSANASNDLPVAANLRLEAASSARHGMPLIILFSRQDCKYCEIIRRDYLNPLATQSDYRERLIIRQVNQDNTAGLIDFNGGRTSHGQFASSQKIRMVPVVAFYGPNGEQLAPPITGLRLPDFYQYYLNDGLEKARKKLRLSVNQ